MSIAKEHDIKEEWAFAKAIHAYLECSDEVQKVIQEMIIIVESPDTDEDEKHLALQTLADALFPRPHQGVHGRDLLESETVRAEHSEELRTAVEELDKEEALFADRLESLMKRKGITQSDLAEQVGVGQPAISMMLSRNCRPQRRTVIRIAKALEVSPEELWPGIS